MEAYTVLRKTAPKSARKTAAKQQSAARISAGTIHDLESLRSDETVVKVQAAKKADLPKGIQEAWSKYSPEVKRAGHLVIYLEIVKSAKTKTGKKSKAKSTPKTQETVGISEQIPANVSA
jgi:hypothetical protein